jgi:LysM repeat protein
MLVASAARADEVTVVGSAKAEETPGAVHDVPANGNVYWLDLAPGEAQAVAPLQSEYWLGVFAARPSPALQSQLKLPKDQGLLVEALQPESPAAKAGLQQYDILLKGNDKPLTDVVDLVQLIHQVKVGKLTLEFLRGGKHETVTVTPTKRPANEPGEMAGTWLPKSAAAERGLYQNLDPNFMGGRPMEFHVIRPGQILPPGGPVPGLAGVATTNIEVTVHTKTTLADGSKVEIIRHGEEPAKVVVTRDKEKWEGVSSDLSKIPEKIRPEVEKLLHPAFDHHRFFGASGGLAGGNVTYFGGAAVPPGLPGQLQISPDVEKRLTELQKQVDELRRSVDTLQGKTKKEPAAKPE